MNKSDLITLRKIVNEEIERRTKINELLVDDKVMEYIHLIKGELRFLSTEDIRGILKEFLKDFEVKKSNNIYVCTEATYLHCEICYEETIWDDYNVNIDTKYADTKWYKDIETGEKICAKRPRSYDTFGMTTVYNDDKIKICDFENNNIVLNPTNSCNNDNNYMNVRLDFFENAYKLGQAKSKKLLLEKYPRLS